MLAGFSPLFVGAVVAMAKHLLAIELERLVSVPYSSGQALQWAGIRMRHTFFLFQSPISRARRCNLYAPVLYVVSLPFQSPICRGRRCNVDWVEKEVSELVFQSPICRGRRCNTPQDGSNIGPSYSFSPLFVGAGVAIKFNILPHFC